MRFKVVLPRLTANLFDLVVGLSGVNQIAVDIELVRSAIPHAGAGQIAIGHNIKYMNVAIAVSLHERQFVIHVIKWTRPSPSAFAYCK